MARNTRGTRFDGTGFEPRRIKRKAMFSPDAGDDAVATARTFLAGKGFGSEEIERILAGPVDEEPSAIQDEVAGVAPPPLRAAFEDAASEGAVPWQGDLAEAVWRAYRAGRLTLLCFGARWCGPCRVFEERVWGAPEVRKEMEHYVPLSLEVDDAGVGRDTAQTFRICAVPTFVILAPRAHTPQSRGVIELSRVVGFRNARRFIYWLSHVTTYHHLSYMGYGPREIARLLKGPKRDRERLPTV